MSAETGMFDIKHDKVAGVGQSHGSVLMSFYFSGVPQFTEEQRVEVTASELWGMWVVLYPGSQGLLF